ncbi:MAG: leucine-rich repeat domain-containing protein [Lachnospiraceae bacterium]|nr:leucine-rich repeat domain-containing protein [Lachnospiraceae bacterium]
MKLKKILAGLAGAVVSATVMPLIISMTARAAVEINEANFPDPVFRSVIAGADYDRDGNGIIDDTEIALTINIYCEGMGITSVQGVEYFTSLQGLWCKDNYISTLDVSNLKNLHGVWCSGNLFTTLDFSGNPELEWVYCYDCNLTSLNVSNNPKMAYLEVNTNPLTTLDVSHNPLLEHLTCGSCELTSLNLGNNPNLTHLDAFRNHLTSLDVSGCPKLKRLDIWDNAGLGSINVSANTGLQYYNCANNDVVSIDVTHNPELQKLICSYNDIVTLDLTHNPKLVYLDCACNNIASLNLSGNPQLYFLQAFTNPFTTLDIGSNPLLIQTYQTGVKKNESAVCQGHSWTLDYGGDTSTGGDNIYFICFDDKVTLSSIPAAGTGTDAGSDAATNGPNIPYDPNLVTREMVLQTLYVREGSPSVAGMTTRFTDVAQGSYYENAIIWGEANSIAVGTPYISSATFGVGKTVTRQDLLLMLMRYSEYKGYKRAIDFGRSDDYLDYYDIDYYAWEAVTWSATWHIMEGIGEPGAPKTEQKIDPHGTVTRTDLITVLNRLMEVNGISNASFTIPETAGVPAAGRSGDVMPAEQGETSGTDETSDEQSLTPGETVADTGADTGADVQDENTDEALEDTEISASEEIEYEPETTDQPEEYSEAGDASESGDKSSSTKPFILFLLIGVIVCIAVYIALRKRGGH